MSRLSGLTNTAHYGLQYKVTGSAVLAEVAKKIEWITVRIKNRREAIQELKEKYVDQQKLLEEMLQGQRKRLRDEINELCDLEVMAKWMKPTDKYKMEQTELYALTHFAREDEDV